MLPVSRPSGRCIYCAFRARQFSLQTQRLRSSTRNERGPKEDRHARSSPIRYLEGQSKRDTLGKGFGRETRIGQGVVRKWLSGRINRESPEERDRRFRDAMQKGLAALKDVLKETPLVEQLAKEREAEGKKPRSFNLVWEEFQKKFVSMAREPIEYVGKDSGDRDVLQDLRTAFQRQGQKGLDGRIKYHFYGHLTGSRFTKSDIRNQQMLADLRYPTEWFPATRAMHRSIHLHVGPTNSGKTYHALQRLEKANSGVYAGPLRLLAHEVYSRMNAKGIPCALITGEERRAAEEGTDSLGKVQSCTVEMMPLNRTCDVAVIDEIQMLGNRERGWAWTQALLGVKAREVHLCGEARTVPLVQELCASVGDKLTIHNYERLSPLAMADESLNGDLKKLRKGDCVVSFSVMGIHALRKQIEQQTGKKVATVYGSLPPETRAQQARLFNDPNNDYDYLVASDAVGMGLNLAIKRVVFEAASKYDGITHRTLDVADIKQIAGRAGRYRTAAQVNEPVEDKQDALAKEDLAAAKGEDDPQSVPTDVRPPLDNDTQGLVTTLEKFDFPIVKKAMGTEPPPIKSAGLFPPAPVLERFASYFPVGTPYSYIVTRLHELSQMHSRFHLCGLKDQIWIADLIEPVRGLTISDRNTICAAPASSSDMELWRDLMPAYAKIIAEQSNGNILDIKEVPLELLETEINASRTYLRSLEQLHKSVVTYLWLSYRFAGIFTTRALAFHIKSMVEEKIDLVLDKFSFSERERRKIAARREKGLLKGLAEMEAEATEEGEKQDGDEEDMDLRDENEGESELDDQTTVTLGGDHISGEQDLPFEDPAIEDAVEEEKPQFSSFAEWRRMQTRGESQGSSDIDAEDSLMGAALDGETAAYEGDVEAVSGERPSAVDAEAEAEPSVSVDAEFPPPIEADADLDGAPVTPETELDTPPLASQEVAPRAEEARVTEDEASEAAQPEGMPPKHLEHMNADISELERGADGRP